MSRQGEQLQEEYLVWSNVQKFFPYRSKPQEGLFGPFDLNESEGLFRIVVLPLLEKETRMVGESNQGLMVVR